MLPIFRNTNGLITRHLETLNPAIAGKHADDADGMEVQKGNDLRPESGVAQHVHA